VNVFLFYLTALLVTCVYLALCGGRTGRWLAAIQLIMAVATAIASYTAADFVELQPRLLATDVLSLCLKLAVAFQSTRRWPMWVAAFQLNSVLAQAAVLLSPAFRDEFFYAMTTVWSVPTLFVMALGLALDRRRLRTHVA
jgi:hypothetical protein